MPFEPFPAAEQISLVVGERLCDLPFHNARGETFSLYDNRVFGWPKVIHVANTPDQAEPELRRLAERYDRFERVETQIFAVTRAPPDENAALAQRLDLPFTLLSDEAGLLHDAAGIGQGDASRTFFFDGVLRLERDVADADAAIAYAEARFASLPPEVAMAQAPVLVVPNVLDPDHCHRLIAFWERGAKRDDRVSSGTGSGVSAGGTKVRADVLTLLGSPESNELVAVMRRRLLPEISKAFNFEITRTENFRIGCYDSADGGRFAAHRDNNTAETRHRRFAMTLNLNTGDYEGGFLRLPEYGPQLYLPPLGGAVVFSCSLLHIATPVIRGRRFALVSFFWGEGEQQALEQSGAHAFPEGPDITRIA